MLCRQILMQGFLAILLLPFLTPSLFAQRNATDYYRTTNEAELAICRKDLPAAAALYAEAFAINPHKPFTKDLLNAFHCAMDLKDYPLARRRFKAILRRGVNQASTEKLTTGYSGTDLKRIRRWLLIYPNRAGASTPAVKTTRAMDSVLHLEIFWPTIEFVRRKIPDTVTESLRKLRETYAKALTELFRINGVPNEKDGSGAGSLTNMPIFQRLAKNTVRTSRRLGYGLDTILFNAIFSYDYHPQQFIKLLHAVNPSDTTRLRYGNFCFVQPLIVPCIRLKRNSTVYPIHIFSDYEKGLVDDQHRAMGLETFDELCIKIHFSNTERWEHGAYAKYELTETASIRFDNEGLTPRERIEFELYMSKRH